MQRKLEDWKEGKDIILETISVWPVSQSEGPEVRQYSGAREEVWMHWSDVYRGEKLVIFLQQLYELDWDKGKNYFYRRVLENTREA